MTSTFDESALTGWLADTWWFALTQRLSDEAFASLTAQRVAEGFTAVQLVVGIPPEVGPENKNSASPIGAPWTILGTFNDQYLSFARQRIKYLNRQGLLVIVYGAWGYQIDWLGQAGMIAWWRKVIETVDDLDVVYCLTGESNLWLSGEATNLLPDKTTANFPTSQLKEWVGQLPYRVQGLFVRVMQGVKRPWQEQKFRQRRQKWSQVLAVVCREASHPFIIHTLSHEISDSVVANPELLAAITTQTGHSEAMRASLWQRPLAYFGQPFINLEPWYEGIHGKFGAEDQLYAYWVSKLAGCISYCYGAHGIWNVGDARFLAQWGNQTFAQAVALDTPRLLGLSHQNYLAMHRANGHPFYETNENQLITIGQRGQDWLVQFFPDVAQAVTVPEGRIWLPLQGVWADTMPRKGQVVIFETL
ncbi:MAG: DUF4038 domain-containing protein [Chloroflexi bacterium]|nr:DUF4038 domain-containing protein [Chloroflexota bacterium]